MDGHDEEVAQPLFRPSKRRKVFRKRADDDDEPTNDAPGELQADAAIAPAEVPHVGSQSEDVTQDDLQNTSVADIIRQRKLAKARRVGIEFSNTQQPRRDDEVAQSTALVPVQDESRNTPSTVQSRFAPRTGQVVQTVDKHMMAYIDSKMAEIRQKQAEEAEAAASSARDTSTSSNTIRERQPAGAGRLQEIDLGPDATMRNIARTEAAARRLETGLPAEEEQQGRPRKVRLGRDGKPMRPRRRNRRGSDDLARDALVDAVLKETRLEIYDEPEDEPSPGNDIAADDRLAEEFRQQFLEDVAARNLSKKPATTVVKKGQPEPPKGPKLGGSRNARAAIRAQEEAAAKKKSTR